MNECEICGKKYENGLETNWCLECAFIENLKDKKAGYIWDHMTPEQRRDIEELVIDHNPTFRDPY